MGRFVKRKSSLEESSWVHHSTWEEKERGVKGLAGVALIIGIMLSIPILLYSIRPLQLSVQVDPDLYTTLSRGQPAYAYISVKSNAVIPVKPVAEYRFGDLRIVKAYLTSLQELQSLAGNPDVISVYGGKQFSHAPLYYLDLGEYPFKTIDADNTLHSATGPWTGRNVTVAVIDTGVDYTHPDFYESNGRIVIKALASMLYVYTTGGYVEWDLQVNPNVNALLEFDNQVWKQYGEPAFLDLNGHGTHVAGIIAGRGWASNGTYRGIAPGVELVVVKAFNRNGQASMDAALKSIEWVYNNTEKYGIKILSLSWGAAYASDGRDPLSLAVDKLYVDKKVWVFCAAGNMGNLPTTVTVPAVARYCLAVGAWDPYKNKIAPFSSLGPTVDLRMKPDFMGAGVMIVSAKSRYASYPPEYTVGDYYVALSGTSMSTPAVAGVAACFIEYYRYWYSRDPDIQDFISWEEENGVRVNPWFKDFLTGWGIPIAPHS